MISQQELIQLYFYNPETGLFFHKHNHRRARKGAQVGSYGTHGYILINLKGKTQKAHRMAWLYTYGEWPFLGIDHINGNTSDNRICNLRLANQSQNMANAKMFKTNQSGAKGVGFRKDTKKWTASLTFNYKKISFGCFDTFEKAVAAYKKGSAQYFGEFANC